MLTSLSVDNKNKSNLMIGDKPGRSKRTSEAASPAAADAAAREQRKEFNYVLQLDAADSRMLRRYHELLSQGAAGFAQDYYDFLFDNPAMAEMLYAHEREGGDVGDLVRSQLQHMLQLLAAEHDGGSALAGQRHFIKGMKPIWVMGAYRLYLNHLQNLIEDSAGVAPEDRRALEAALVKRVFLDLGLMLQGHWDTSRQRLEAGRQAAEAAHTHIENLLANTSQYLWSYNIRAQELLYVSPALRASCHSDAADPIPCFEQVHADDRERVTAAWQSALEGETVEVQARVGLQGDGDRWCSLRFQPAGNGRRRVQRIDGLLVDITETQNALDVLEHRATTDELTGLANRTLWCDRINQALSTQRREEAREVVLMLVDLDHFKLVNDELGYAAGDEVLRQVARRLKAALRDSDTLARLDGDEFGILMPAVPGGEHAGERVAAKVLGCFEQPFHVADRELFMNASIGIATSPGHGEDVEILLSHADIAMHRAKRSDGHYSFYTDGGASGTRQLQFSGQLRDALERNEFELYYQPKLQLHDRQVCGVEALLRWQHPQHGLVRPGQFLPVAEQIGLMVPITSWVLVTALRQCRSWQEAGIHVPVAVNVSARDFQNPRLPERIRWALDAADVHGDCLEIEITEDTLMADLEGGVETLDRLRGLGVTVAIDDFGTGYSSLAYLKRLAISTLKIDKSFLTGMVRDGHDAMIVRSIIDLGHNLGFRLVAEGVEDAQICTLLAELGCDAVQGYHVSRPLPDTVFADWLRAAPRDRPA